MSFFKLSDENIAAVIDHNRVKIKYLLKSQEFELAAISRDETKRFEEYFLMNHPEPIKISNLAPQDSSRIAYSGSKS